MIDGRPKPVRIAGYLVTRPWCDCTPQGRGFTLSNDQWVKPCCGRPTFTAHQIHTVKEQDHEHRNR